MTAARGDRNVVSTDKLETLLYAAQLFQAAVPTGFSARGHSNTGDRKVTHTSRLESLLHPPMSCSEPQKLRNGLLSKAIHFNTKA